MLPVCWKNNRLEKSVIQFEPCNGYPWIYPYRALDSNIHQKFTPKMVG
jgi:hypothetical protein